RVQPLFPSIGLRRVTCVRTYAEFTLRKLILIKKIVHSIRMHDLLTRISHSEIKLDGFKNPICPTTLITDFDLTWEGQPLVDGISRLPLPSPVFLTEVLEIAVVVCIGVLRDHVLLFCLQKSRLVLGAVR